MTENNNVDGVTVEATQETLPAQEPLTAGKKRGVRVKETVSNLDSAPSATKPAQNSLDDDGVTVETAQENSNVQPDEATPTAATPTGNEKEPKANEADTFKFSVYLEQPYYDALVELSKHSEYSKGKANRGKISKLVSELIKAYVDANRELLEFYTNPNNRPTEKLLKF